MQDKNSTCGVDEDTSLLACAAYGLVKLNTLRTGDADLRF